jgi:hypothetical protein
MPTQYDNDRSLREIDEVYYANLEAYEKDKAIKSEIEFIEAWLSVFVKVVGCSCCYSHEFKLRERLKQLKNGKIKGRY